jgi:hypothetical protein
MPLVGGTALDFLLEPLFEKPNALFDILPDHLFEQLDPLFELFERLHRHLKRDRSIAIL